MSDAHAHLAEGHAPTYYRVYVWELPIRVFHWINALAILLLISTGFVIGNPFIIKYGDEAYQQYWFGTVRFVHFMSAWVFFVNFAVRIYWGFVGDEYSRWWRFIPYTREQWHEIVEVLKVDIFQTTSEGEFNSGHNSLAAFTYFLSFIVYAFQIATGFALYAAMSEAWIPGLFAWVVPLMGGDANVRFWHHTAMWFFVLFTIVHVYLVFYHDYVEGRGTTSSIVGGWKFARTEGFEPHDPAADD